MAKQFIRPEGHNCGISTHIGDLLTFGTGKLDGNGFWEHPCEECARAHEQQFPEGGPCWPHTREDLLAMGFKPETSTNRFDFRSICSSVE